MAQGMRINTTSGVADISDSRSMQIVHYFTPTTLTGSITISGFDVTKGVAYSKALDGDFIQNNDSWSGDTYSWSFSSGVDLTKMRILFFSVKESSSSSYGFRFTNDNGEVVIDDNLPVMGLKSSATISNDGTYSGFYKFNAPSSATTEVVGYQLDVGQWISVGFGLILSNQSTLQRVVMDTPENITLSDDYGAVIRNADGEITWHHQMAMGNMQDASYTGYPSSPPVEGNTIANLKGNTIFIEGTYMAISFSYNSLTVYLRATRTSSDNIELKYFRYGPDGSLGTAAYFAATSAVSASVT